MALFFSELKEEEEDMMVTFLRSLFEQLVTIV